jgi:hypothetical protein
MEITPQDDINAGAIAAQAAAAYRRAEINLSCTVRARVSCRSGGLTMRTGNLIAPRRGVPEANRQPSESRS